MPRLRGLRRGLVPIPLLISSSSAEGSAMLLSFLASVRTRLPFLYGHLSHVPLVLLVYCQHLLHLNPSPLGGRACNT